MCDTRPPRVDRYECRVAYINQSAVNDTYDLGDQPKRSDRPKHYEHARCVTRHPHRYVGDGQNLVQNNGRGVTNFDRGVWTHSPIVN